MNLAIKKSRLRSSVKSGVFPLKQFKTNKSKSEKNNKKLLIIKQDEKNNNPIEIETASKKDETQNSLKVSNSMNKKLKQQLFSEKTSQKNPDQIKTENACLSDNNASKAISKFTASDIKIKKLKTVSELEIKNIKLLPSGIPEKKFKSNRENMVTFKKFSTKKVHNDLKKNSNKIIQIDDGENDLKAPQKASLTSTLKRSNKVSNLDFIENVNLKRLEKFPKEIKSEMQNSQISPQRINLSKNKQTLESKELPKKIRLYESKHYEIDSEVIKDSKNIDNPPNNAEFITFTNKINVESNYNTDQGSRESDNFQNLYDSIGKIKEFVKKTSVIEIKTVNQSHNLKHLNKKKSKLNPMYQSEQGKEIIPSNESNSQYGKKN